VTSHGSTDPVVVAIDGPAGSGKSSVAKGVARVLGLVYLDSGAMYRALTWAVLDQGIDLDDLQSVSEVADRVGPTLAWSTDPDQPTTLIGDLDVSTAIRQAPVTSAVSHVAAVPRVREVLVDCQRRAVSEAQQAGQGIVVEGRDIGSIVLPNADVKIWLIADPLVRAARRAAEDVAAGRTVITDVEAVAADLARRDTADATRAVSPTTRPVDAFEVDASHLTLQEVIALVANIVSTHTSAQSTQSHVDGVSP